MPAAAAGPKVLARSRSRALIARTRLQCARSIRIRSKHGGFAPRCAATSDHAAASWAVDIVAGWNGRSVVGADMTVTSRGDALNGPDPLAANAARNVDRIVATPTLLASAGGY